MTHAIMHQGYLCLQHPNHYHHHCHLQERHLHGAADRQMLRLMTQTGHQTIDAESGSRSDAILQSHVFLQQSINPTSKGHAFGRIHLLTVINMIKI
eukprot:868429-Amphidinium_carterae.1